MLNIFIISADIADSDHINFLVLNFFIGPISDKDVLYLSRTNEMAKSIQ